jgi:hypothetical protein
MRMLQVSNYANSSRLIVGSLRPLFIVMGHLEPCSSVSTLHIESFVCLTAIQYALIASHLFCQVVQCLYESQAQFLPLLVLGNGDIFDMAHKTEAVDELALNNYGTRTNDDVLAIADHQDIVGVIAGCHEVISLVEFRESGLADGGQDSECWEEGCRTFLSAKRVC